MQRTLAQACLAASSSLIASRVTQSNPNNSGYGIGGRRYKTATRLWERPSSVTVLIACGRLCHGVVGGRRAKQPDAGFQQVVGDLAIDRLVSIVTPDAA